MRVLIIRTIILEPRAPMPRQDHDIADALDAAKEVFWRRGYDDASIEDVVKATGFNRYAIYSAFGGKLELFLAALDAYYHEGRDKFLKSLEAADAAPLDAIEEMLHWAVNEMAMRGSGCLICNIATEVGRHEEVVAERIASYLEEMNAAMAAALAMAQERGELNPALTPEAGASLLISVKLGLGVHARNGATKDEMLKIADTAMTVIRPAADILDPV